MQELTPAEIQERDQCIRKLKEELRGEETKLVLLKKLKQSQQLKVIMYLNLTLTLSFDCFTKLFNLNVYLNCNEIINLCKMIFFKDGLTVLPANTTLTPAQPGSGGATPLLSNKSSLTVTPAIGNNLPGLTQQPQPAHLRSSKPATVLRGVILFNFICTIIVFNFWMW